MALKYSAGCTRVGWAVVVLALGLVQPAWAANTQNCVPRTANEKFDEHSQSRIPLPDRDSIGAVGQKVYDQLVNPNGGTIRGLVGPGGLQLHSPELAARMFPVVGYFRRAANLDLHSTEVAVLTVARALDNQFIWTTHEGEAIKANVAPKVIDVIKHDKPVAGLSERDAIIIELGRAIFQRHYVDRPLYDRALAEFGKRDLVDLVGLMSTYVGFAALLSTFALQLDAGVEPLLPIATACPPQ